MAIDEGKWDGDASQWKDAKSYCKSCLIDENVSGQEPTKQACKLPVYTPEGTLNRNAVHSAASVLSGGMGGVSASASAKKAAARKLVKLYGEIKDPVPSSIKQMAR